MYSIDEVPSVHTLVSESVGWVHQTLEGDIHVGFCQFSTSLNFT
jgi:hypothetical protein